MGSLSRNHAKDCQAWEALHEAVLVFLIKKNTRGYKMFLKRRAEYKNKVNLNKTVLNGAIVDEIESHFATESLLVFSIRNIVNHDIHMEQQTRKKLERCCFLLENHSKEGIDLLKGLPGAINEQSISFELNKDIDLNSVIVDTLIFFSREGKITTDNLFINIPGGAVVRSNAALLKKIFISLIENAQEAVDRDTGRVEVSYREDEKTQYLSVKDNGRGILAKDIPNIFKEEFGAKPTVSSLAVCKKLIRGLGGDITCVSEPNKFTEFTLAFPRG